MKCIERSQMTVLQLLRYLKRPQSLALAHLNVPGSFNETVFRALDYVLAQAARFKLKARPPALSQTQIYHTSPAPLLNSPKFAWSRSTAQTGDDPPIGRVPSRNGRWP